MKPTVELDGGRIRLYHADCLDVLPTLPEGSVPLVIADPPYGIGYHSNHYKGKNPHAPVANDWNFQPGAFFGEVFRVLKDGGAMYLFCRWDVMPLWLPYLNGAGLKVKTVIAWIKDNWSAGDLEGCFGNQYEQIIFAVKGRHKLRGRRWPNVWNFPRVPHTQMVHPTQKPTTLLDRAIRSSSDKGDVVLDPFAGSGSTGEAAVDAGRLSLLTDVDGRMVAIAAKRLGMAWHDDAPRDDAPVRHRLEIPEPHEWGIHPEELAAIRDAMSGNVEFNAPKPKQTELALG